MTSLDIIGLRLHNQQISHPVFETPTQVVSWLGAVQAQDYMSAKWAVGLRMKHASDEALDRALADGSIIRTHVMRPTWHFVSPADVRWMLDLTASQINAAMSYNFRRLGLTEAVFKRSNSALAKALTGGKQLTRLELVAILKRQGIRTDNLGFLHILLRAEIDRVICSGGRRGKQFTYALLDERVPHAPRLKRDEALAELALRYFTSHGPATVQDFAWWSGLTVADGRTAFGILRSRLIYEEFGGQAYWFAASKPPGGKVPRSAWLLPNFDEYMVGYSDRTALIDPGHTKKLDGFASALLNNSLVIDGRIVGTWKRTFKKDAVLIELKLFASLKKAGTKELDSAIKRYADFLGLPAVVKS
jgi:hypothetical protein